MVPSLAWQYRYFEPELGRLNEFVPEGRGAVDVGVWWGPWSWWLARRVPRVDSFEPNPDFIARLESAMPENVNIHPVALSNQSGRSNLWVPPGGANHSGRASLEPQTRAGSDWRQQAVQTSRLDDFELGDVGFVKIDVEGHELAVLQGATDLLKTQRPTLLVEIEQHAGWPGFARRDCRFLRRLLVQRGVSEKGRWHPISELDRQRTKQMAARVAQHGYVVNLLSYARRYVHNFVFKPL